MVKCVWNLDCVAFLVLVDVVELDKIPTFEPLHQVRVFFAAFCLRFCLVTCASFFLWRCLHFVSFRAGVWPFLAFCCRLCRWNRLFRLFCWCIDKVGSCISQKLGPEKCRNKYTRALDLNRRQHPSRGCFATWIWPIGRDFLIFVGGFPDTPTLWGKDPDFAVFQGEFV